MSERGKTIACSLCLEEIPIGAITCPGCGHPLAAIVHVRGTRERDPNFSPFPEEIANRGTPKRREQDIRMMKSPQHWPNRHLAMKKWDMQTQRIEFAVWDGTTLKIDALMLGDMTARAASLMSTATPEEIVDAGWTVD